MAKKIKVNIFDDMREAMQDALAYERGAPVNLRVTRRFTASPRSYAKASCIAWRMSSKMFTLIFFAIFNLPSVF